MRGFLGSNNYAGGNEKLNCFLVLEIENLKLMQNMCVVVCTQIFVWEKFLGNGFKNGVVFL